ncbi:PAS domain S-box protein [Metabacillus fastidiosus]|uniref:histidine kinase n=1 Tax=Metabacillus fastidiosus TaxID=1458 RepID=A0ABU6P2Y1_9BACI|nr:PAS domain S-box protein [Metabacillus fastidiosus]MED4402506.1 PAS domain S-box protein [Metabacillus fastidiosus]MED4461793.1 PAS domain S-box protein [Metabacillus fastidiosus]
MSKKRKVFIIFLISSLLWIFSTNYVLSLFDLDYEQLFFLEQWKDFIFVLLCSIYFYFFIVKREGIEYIVKQKQQEKLETLTNAMVDFVVFKDGEGKWIQTNEFARKLFQVENIKHIGKTNLEIAEYIPTYRETLEICQKADEEAWSENRVHRHIEVIPMPDGSNKLFDTVKIPTFNEDGSRKELVGLGRDITDKVAAEKKLAESEQRYKSLFEYNPELVYMIDLNGRLTNVNSNLHKLTGYTSAEYMNESILPIIAKKDRPKVKKAFIEAIKHKRSWMNNEIELITKDKSRKIVRCTAVPMIINEQIVGLIGYAIDITKEKETEEILRRTEKLSVVGELAAGVAHEIRNPLTSLIGFVQMLQQSGKESDQFYYKIMLDELDRINDIASELLALAKPQKIKFEKKDLNDIFSSVISLFDTQVNSLGIQLKLDAAESIPLIYCEPNQLKQLFINIIKNSIEASAHKIEITLSKPDNKYISIKVEDDGCGIEESRLKHLGEPFYSSKEKGTGLGLTVSHRIVDSHKGEIFYHSKVGNGTIVHIILPIQN